MLLKSVRSFAFSPGPSEANIVPSENGTWKSDELSSPKRANTYTHVRCIVATLSMLTIPAGHRDFVTTDVFVRADFSAPRRLVHHRISAEMKMLCFRVDITSSTRVASGSLCPFETWS